MILYLIYPIIKIFNKTKKRNFKLFSWKRYSRYIRIIFTKNVLILIISTSILSNSIILVQNKKFENIYRNFIGQNIEIQGKIVSEEKEKYKLKVTSKQYKNMYLYLKCKEKLTYGDEVKIYGEYEIPTLARNYKGFNYRNYLKTLKIAGTIKSKKLEIIKKQSVNFFYLKINELSTVIKKKIENFNLEKEEKAIIEGILLGDKSELTKQTIKNFSDSNLSHILAISGMHIAYIILIINMLFTKIVGKHISKILTSLIVLFYMCLTKFPITLVRAGISGIILIMSSFFYRKNDIWQSLSLSLLIILIYNPFSILNIGLQLSYSAIIGIVVFEKILNKSIKTSLERLNNRAIRKNKKKTIFFLKLLNSKIVTTVLDSFLVTLSCIITITPIILYHFNTLTLLSIFLNIFASFVIGPIIIFGLICLILNFEILELLLSLCLKILIFISQLGSKISINKFYLGTPNILEISIYYFIVFLGATILKIKSEQNPNMFYIRVRNILSYIKYKKKFKKIKIILILLIFFLCFTFYSFIPKRLKVHFVDVGQRRLHSY